MLAKQTHVEPLKVFISYAWEPEPFREKVGQLAAWLTQNSNDKIIVTTDHLFANRAPKEGWPIWMLNQIEESDIVLVVCSPLYHARFKKKESNPEKGKGVIYEGTIITQQIFNCQASNEKFFPILPDDGKIDNVPTILQPFFNGHRFPGGNDGVLKLILNDNPTYDNYIKPFFEAESIDEGVKEALAVSFQEDIINEIEREILDDFVQPNIRKGKSMQSILQSTIRAFLTLSDIDKLKIIRKIGIDITKLNDHNTIERDKEIFKIISSQKLIDQLWDEIHAIKPFSTNLNPFKK